MHKGSLAKITRLPLAREVQIWVYCFFEYISDSEKEQKKDLESFNGKFDKMLPENNWIELEEKIGWVSETSYG